MDLGEPLVLPVVALPEPLKLPLPVLEVPEGLVPSYKPLVVPPADLRPPPGVKGTTPSEREAAPPPTPRISVPTTPTIRIPSTDIDVPVPSAEILTTAATTAVVSVAATLTATSLFKWCVSAMKPVFKAAWTKITKKKGSSNSSSLSGPPDS